MSSGKIGTCEYLAGKDILPSDQSRIIEQAKLTCFPFGKSFEKQTKIIEEQVKKQDEVLKVLKPEENNESIKSIEGHFPKDMRTSEIKNEMNDIEEWESKIWNKNYIYDLPQYDTIRSFGDSIYNGKISINEAEIKQAKLLECIVDFGNKSRPRSNKRSG